MDDATREALRDLLGSNVVEVHDLRPETTIRKVWRVRTAGQPESVIVRAVVGDGDDAARAWTMVDRDAVALATAASSGCVPAVVFHDRDRRIVVTEDLGGGRSLADALLDDDADAARRGLVALAAALGRVHAATASPGAADHGIHMTTHTADRTRALADAVAPMGVPAPDAVFDDIDVAVRELLDPGPLNALVHGDPCPDNNVIRGDGSVALFDFEWAGMGSAALDAAYLHLPFPSCWCANAIPPEVVEEADDAYRGEFVVDAGAYERGLATAAVAWCVTTIAWDIPRFDADDRSWGIAPHRPRHVTRLRAARQLCERAGRFAAFTAFADATESALARRWPDAADGLPLYPAFR